MPLHPAPRNQTGVATLAVTLILTLIATLFVLSTNKNSYLFQKTSVNHYQQTQAFEAAEAGAQATLLQMRRDIAAINLDPAFDGVILKKSASNPPPAPGTNQCGWDSAVNLGDSYQFSNQFISNKLIFSAKNNSLFQQIGNQKINADHTAWRSTINLTTGIVSSEGCADEAANQGPYCNNAASDQTAAVVRRGFDIPTKAIFNPKKIALTVKGHVDMSGSMTLDPHSGQPAPLCNVSTGGALDRWGAGPGADSTHNSALANLTDAQIFGAIFGMSPASFKAQATQINPTGGGSVVTSCPQGSGLIWINGDFTPPANCVIGSSYPVLAPTIVVVGGSGSHSLAAGGPGGNMISVSTLISGMLFTRNFNGSIQVLGAMAVNGDIEGQLNGSFDTTPNDCQFGMCAARPTGSNGAINVAYDERMFIGASAGGNLSGNKPGSWHDFCGKGQC